MFLSSLPSLPSSPLPSTPLFSPPLFTPPFPPSPPLSFLPSPPLPSLPPQCPTSSDENHLLPLVMEVVPQHACLVFCPTKKNCQNVALLLAQNLPRWVEPTPPCLLCSRVEACEGMQLC